MSLWYTLILMESSNKYNKGVVRHRNSNNARSINCSYSFLHLLIRPPSAARILLLRQRSVFILISPHRGLPQYALISVIVSTCTCIDSNTRFYWFGLFLSVCTYFCLRVCAFFFSLSRGKEWKTYLPFIFILIQNCSSPFSCLCFSHCYYVVHPHSVSSGLCH